MYVLILLACAVLATITPSLGAQPAQDLSPRGPYAAQLAAECDQLLRVAVRKPYGWGWLPVSLDTPVGPQPQAIAMQPPGSAAAGLLLLWAGDLLHEPRYQQAAVEAARGLATTQEPTGRIPAHPTFGPSAGGRDTPSAAPDRAATRASLSLLLTLLDTQARDNEYLARAAKRATTWLLRQQTPNGGWPATWPPDASPQTAVRLFRLDTPDYRDSTLALILAGQVFEDPVARHGAERAVTLLLRLRLDEPGLLGHNLWTTVDDLQAQPMRKLSSFPHAIDLVASRYAMQTLLAADLVLDDRAAASALEQSARLLGRLAPSDRQWSRLYDIASARPLALSQPSTLPSGIFASPPATAPTTSPADASAPQPPAIVQATLDATAAPDDILQAVADLQTLGEAKYRSALAASFSIKQRLAQCLAGLADSPFAVDQPQTPDALAADIQRHQARWALLDGPIPHDLPARLQRLWLLYLRAKLEAHPTTNP